MERRPTAWHSGAARARHRMTSKKQRSRARSGRLVCRVGRRIDAPYAVLGDIDAPCPTVTVEVHPDFHELIGTRVAIAVFHHPVETPNRYNG